MSTPPISCNGKCIKFSTLTTAPGSWLPLSLYDDAQLSAEELMAIALGEEPELISMGTGSVGSDKCCGGGGCGGCGARGGSGGGVAGFVGRIIVEQDSKAGSEGVDGDRERGCGSGGRESEGEDGYKDLEGNEGARTAQGGLQGKTMSKSTWVKDTGGWKCLRSEDKADDGGRGNAGQGRAMLVRTLQIVWMVGVCKEHGLVVEVSIEIMD
jgi:hypothetical protein